MRAERPWNKLCCKWKWKSISFKISDRPALMTLIWGYFFLHTLLRTGISMWMTGERKCPVAQKVEDHSFLQTWPGFLWTRLGIGNVVLHEGFKTTLVHDVSMMILTVWIFDVLTSFSHQFPPNVSTSTYKRGAVLNFSWSKNAVILA